MTEDKEVRNAITLLEPLILSQTNIKELKIVSEVPGVKSRVKVDYGKIGPDFGADAPKVIAHIAGASAETILQHIKGKGKYTFTDGKKFDIVPEHLIVQRTVPEHFVEVQFSHGLLYLDKTRSEMLEGEGFARELMRRIQALRKRAGLHKSDKITLHITTDDDVLRKWEKQIKEKVNARSLVISDARPSVKYAFESTEKIKYLEFFVYLT